MAYTVLARKYRSRNFDEVIGQEPVAQTLAAAIRTGRIAHAFLFTGTRGTGKTSMARILAKSLNCLRSDGPTITPCLECESCKAIAEGQDIDVVEIDAASNTGVDNIRELRGNAAYRPARARFKVYIIDEVHMLSTGAFNALLKTLEEPPAHVKFILATTELQKVPATIQSRCQRFTFRNIGPDAIAKRLEAILAAEGAQADPAAVRRIARLANGSMRDALSILDQVLSLSPESVSAALLDQMIPAAQDEHVLAILESAAAGNPRDALSQFENLLDHGRGLEVFCADLVGVLRNLMLMRAAGPDSDLLDLPSDQRPRYAVLADQFELSQYVQMISMIEELRRNVRYSSSGRALADAVVVRLAHMRQWASIESLLEQSLTREGAANPALPGEKKKFSPSPPAPIAINPPARSAPATAERRNDGVTRPPRAVTRRQEDVANPALAPPGVPEMPWDPDFAEPHAAAESSATPRSDEPEPASAQPTMFAPADWAAPLTAAERDRVERDPLVRAAIELFEARIVNIERRADSSPAPADVRE